MGIRQCTVRCIHRHARDGSHGTGFLARIMVLYRKAHHRRGELGIDPRQAIPFVHPADSRFAFQHARANGWPILPQGGNATDASDDDSTHYNITPFTVMLRLASSTASAFAAPIMPAFAAL